MRKFEFAKNQKIALLTIIVVILVGAIGIIVDITGTTKETTREDISKMVKLREDTRSLLGEIEISQNDALKSTVICLLDSAMIELLYDIKQIVPDNKKQEFDNLISTYDQMYYKDAVDKNRADIKAYRSTMTKFEGLRQSIQHYYKSREVIDSLNLLSNNLDQWRPPPESIIAEIKAKLMNMVYSEDFKDFTDIDEAITEVHASLVNPYIEQYKYHEFATHTSRLIEAMGNEIEAMK